VPDVFHTDKAGLSNAAGIKRSIRKDLDGDDPFIKLQWCVEALSDRLLLLASDVGGIPAVQLP
jgi:hypothetical protein